MKRAQFVQERSSCDSLATPAVGYFITHFLIGGAGWRRGGRVSEGEDGSARKYDGLARGKDG